MHLRRALGILTSWDRFKKATEVNLDALDNDNTIVEGMEEAVIEDDIDPA